MTSDNPKHWYKWLALAEFWYNTSYHSALQCTPFEALYGYPPPHMELGEPPVTSRDPIDLYLKERAQTLQKLKDNLAKAQARAKQIADKGRTDREFMIGDWVYLKLQPYRQTSLALRRSLKLSSRYYGPYQVLGRVGPSAYKLKLPQDSQLHPVCHLGGCQLPQTSISQLPSLGSRIC
jgi:hypothetical protein